MKANRVIYCTTATIVINAKITNQVVKPLKAKSSHSFSSAVSLRLCNAALPQFCRKASLTEGAANTCVHQAWKVGEKSPINAKLKLSKRTGTQSAISAMSVNKGK